MLLRHSVGLLGAALGCSSSEAPVSLLADNPLPKHWVSVHVILAEPLPIAGGPDTAVGYYRNFGLACPADSVRQLVEEHVRDGTVDWLDSEVTAVDPSSLDPEILEQASPLAGSGIWYASGRAFHGPE